MSEWTLRLLANAAWQVPLIAGFGWCVTRPLRRWPASWAVAAWRAAWILAIAAPLATSTWTIPAAVAIPKQILAAGTTAGTGASAKTGHTVPWLFVLYACFVAVRGAGLVRAWWTLRDLDESNVSVPLTFGFRNPRILLPSQFRAQAPETAQRAALAHEHAHIEHRDYLTQLLLEIATLPLSFHPAFLWIRRQTLEAIEMRCDETASERAFGGNFGDYASALLEAARVLGGSEIQRIPRLAATFLTHNTFEERIMNLTQSKSIPGKIRATLATFALCLAGTLVAGMSVSLAAQAPEKAYKVGEDGVKAPKLVYKVEPQYSDQARDEKVSGTVILSVEVNKSGLAENIAVIRKLEPSLDDAAIAAVKQWKFDPATRNGEAVRVKATIEVNFRRQ